MHLRPETRLRAELDETPLDGTLEDLSRNWQADIPVECECDHGDEAEYAACGRRAKWRVTIDCTCGEDHPRVVELLCTKCLRVARKDLGNEAITARPL